MFPNTVKIWALEPIICHPLGCHCSSFGIQGGKMFLPSCVWNVRCTAFHLVMTGLKNLLGRLKMADLHDICELKDKN